MFNLWRDSIDSQLEKRCSFYGCIELACFSRISDNYSPSDNQNWADLGHDHATVVESEYLRYAAPEENGEFETIRTQTGEFETNTGEFETNER